MKKKRKKKKMEGEEEMSHPKGVLSEYYTQTRL